MINAPASTLALNFGGSIYHLWGGWQSGLYWCWFICSEWALGGGL